VEMLGSNPEADAERFEAVLGAMLEAELISDAAIAKSQSERDALWGLRDDVIQPFRNGPAFTYDISLPIPRMPAYVAQVKADLAARWPKAELTVFGHLGDGNIHLVAGVGDRGAKHAIEEIVYAPLKAFAGSVSAEHGIGLQKKAYLGVSRSPVEVALMRTLKDALDPKGILNPGKILG
jgi:FAD/FMN-containing dehydrogenase